MPSSPNINTIYSIPIKFGKHKGKNIQLLINQDPKYILWLVKQPWLSQDILEEIQIRFPEMILPFGRHQGKTLKMIREIDLSYYTWLLKDTNLDSMS